MSSRTFGVLEVLLSGFLFGFLGLFGKWAYDKGVEPFEFLTFRYLLAAAMTAAVILVRDRRFSTFKLGYRKVGLCLGLGILGYAVFSGFYFLALERISASMTVILLYTYPVLVAILGSILFSEKIPRAKQPAIPMAFLGLIGLVWLDVQIGSPVGLIFGLLAAVFYTVYILVSSRFLKSVDAMVSTFWIQFGAGLSLFLISFKSVDRTIEVVAAAWLEMVLIAFFCSVLAMWLFLSGLSKVKSWEASLLSMAEPIAGVALGVLILGEKMVLVQWLGAALVLGSLALISWPNRVSNRV